MRRRLAPAAVLALAGCAAPGPPPTPFVVTAFAPDRLDLAAGGAAVAVAPPAGLCLDEDGLTLTPDAAMVLLEKCAVADRLTRTVLVGDEPLAERGGRDAALDAMAAALGEPEGWRAVGLPGAALDVLAVRREADALLVVVQDREGASEASPHGRRCRAFTEIGGRLAIVTVAAAPGGEVTAETLLREAGAMLAALRRANAPVRARAPVFGAPPVSRPVGRAG